MYIGLTVGSLPGAWPHGFDKILTQKFLYLQVGKHLRVEICNVASLGHYPHTVEGWDLN